MDYEGLIWLGSDNGIKSYDGYRFTTYKNAAKSPNILPDNTVVSLTADHDHGIWIGTRNGLARLDKRTGKIKKYTFPALGNREIYPLYTSQNGDIWMGYGGYLIRYIPQQKKFYYFNSHNTHIETIGGKMHPMNLNDIQSFAEAPNGKLYIGTWSHGIYQMDINKRILYKLATYPEQEAPHTMKFDQKGRLWIGTWGSGISCLTQPHNKKQPGYISFYKGGNEFTINYRLIEDPISHTIWACSRDGIGIIDENDINAGVKYVKEIGIYQKYNIQSTKDLVTDNQGNIWALTLNKGLLHLYTKPSLFQINSIPSQDRTINSINAISTLDGKHFWFSLAPAGIAFYDMETHRVLYNYEIPALKNIPYRPINTHINAILQRKNGEVWMASHGFGIIIIKNGMGKLYDKNNCPFIKENTVKALLCAKDGTIFIGEKNYLSYILPSGKIVNKSINGEISAIFEAHDGSIWLATEDKGIIHIHGDFHKPHSLIFEYYNPQNKKLPINDIVNCIEDSHHRIWAISKSGGLFEYEKATNQFININEGLKGQIDRILGIAEDCRGNLWLTTDNTLIHLSIDKKGSFYYTAYTHEDGLGEILFQPNSCYRLGNMMYFGSGKNIISFDASHIPAYPVQKSSSNIVVTDLIINDKRYAFLDSALQARICGVAPSSMKEITLPAFINKFSFEFSLLSYRNAELCKYAYRLEGYDDKWHYVDAYLRQATFENLPSGTYHLHLKAVDSYGRWSELPYRIKIKILPPWYATWWAKLLYQCAILAILYLAVVWYRARLRNKNRLQMANVFTNITHELLTPLSIISAAADTIQLRNTSAAKETGIIHSNIERLTRMLRQILEVRKSQAGKLKLQVSEGNLGDFCQQTANDIMPMFIQKNIQLDTDIVASKGEKEEWFDTDKMEKILYNLLSNAAKYTPNGGKAKLSVNIQDSQACIMVSDTGIGMSANKQRHLYQRFLDGDYRQMQTVGTGLGLSLVKDLVKLHHGTIKCKSEEGQGTTFTLHIPICKNNYEESELVVAKKITRREEAVQAIVSASSIPQKWDEEESYRESYEEENKGKNEEEYTILLVEDNVELLTLMSRLLGTHYQIKTAGNGEKAQRIIQKTPLDIVITDIMMPVMDGIELTHWIKNSKEYAQLPVIMLTAKTKGDDRNEGYRVGADDYITKPFNIADLQVRIDNIIANRKRIKERFQMQTEYKVEDQHYSSPDEVFLKNAIEMVLAHITDSDYGRENLASDLCISSSTLYNKLRAITGSSISSFINSIRLKEACKILQQAPNMRIAVIAVKVGFATPRYFSQCFKKEFGMTVREYADIQSDRQGK